MTEHEILRGSWPHDNNKSGIRRCSLEAGVNGLPAELLAPKRQAVLVEFGESRISPGCNCFPCMNLRVYGDRWHVIRFLAGLIGVFSANLAADIDGCRNGWRHAVDSHLYPFEV
jgi:hypothetical protein